jgi:hypothetical protein
MTRGLREARTGAVCFLSLTRLDSPSTSHLAQTDHTKQTMMMLKDISQYTNDELSSLLDAFNAHPASLVDVVESCTASSERAAVRQQERSVVVPSFAFGSLLPPPAPPAVPTGLGFGADEALMSGWMELIEGESYLFVSLFLFLCGTHLGSSSRY